MAGSGAGDTPPGATIDTPRDGEHSARAIKGIHMSIVLRAAYTSAATISPQQLRVPRTCTEYHTYLCHPDPTSLTISQTRKGSFCCDV